MVSGCPGQNGVSVQLPVEVTPRPGPGPVTRPSTAVTPAPGTRPTPGSVEQSHAQVLFNDLVSRKGKCVLAVCQGKVYAYNKLTWSDFFHVLNPT